MLGHPTPGTRSINAGVFEPASGRCYGPAVLRLGLVTLLLMASACARFSTDRTPRGALERFLEAMGEAQDDPAARARAFALLAPETRSRLAARARLAAALSGRHFEPHEMLVEGRYRLRFRPRESHGFEVRTDGSRAIVVVVGDHPGERAEVPMVREGARWRVFLEVPELGREAPAVPAGASRSPAHPVDAGVR